MSRGRQTESRSGPEPAEGRLRHGLTHPLVMFPLLGLVLLAMLAATTAHLIRVTVSSARDAGVSMALDAADTYEAQVVRALREVQQSLELVAYVYERQQPGDGLKTLAQRGLLPPELLFAVAVFDHNGRLVDRRGVGVIDAHPPAAALQPGPGRVRWHEPSGQYLMDFSRELRDREARRIGSVTIAADASYFVSGYDPARLGEQGVLGILGRDGAFRVWRSGDRVSHTGSVDYAALLTDSTRGEVRRNSWDGVERYTVAREIYGFPVAIVTGLSAVEQLAAARAQGMVYLRRATAVAIVLLGVLAVLGWMSWQLQRERHRAVQRRVAHAQQVEHLAYYDSLTGLPNRAHFGRLLGGCIEQARAAGRSVALIFIDLDYFKDVNDTLGHDAGDELLVELGRRLRDALRSGDVVARLGGDEFVALADDVGDADALDRVAEKILETARRPFLLAGERRSLSLSVGVAVFPRDGTDARTLMQHADEAMYRAKHGGRDRCCVYGDPDGAPWSMSA